MGGATVMEKARGARMTSVRVLWPAGRWQRLAMVVLLLAAMCGGLAFALGEPATKVTAYFPQARGIYEGDDVTLLGVPIGHITEIDAQPRRVRVEMEIDPDVTLPADASAAITAPALVTVRTIALGPTYDGGPKLESGAVIPESRTSAPVEWDEVKTELTRLTKALGPNGANKNGALNHLVGSTAGFLDGQGHGIRTSIEDMSEAMSTLADNRGEVFATVRNLQVFISAIRGSDAQVRSFNGNLAIVSSAFADDRVALKKALRGLRIAFVNIQDFIRTHEDLALATLKELRSTTSLLADNQQGLADVLHLAPTTLSNFYNVMDPRNGATTGVVALENFNNPAQIVCAALLNLGGRPQDCATILGPIVDQLAVPAPQINPPPLQIPSDDNTQPGGGNLDDVVAGLLDSLGGGQ